MSDDHSSSPGLQALPFWAALLPLATINTCYLIAVGFDHVPSCIPYLTGCTSTSATGRLPPESLVFRAGMISAAVAILLFWTRCGTFLKLGGRSRWHGNVIALLGVVATISLVLYTVALGLAGDQYRLLRRVGIDGFFIANYVAQVLLLAFHRPLGASSLAAARRYLIGFSVLLPLALAAGELLKVLGVSKDAVNNIVEWNGIVLVCAYFMTVAWLWREHGFVHTFRLTR